MPAIDAAKYYNAHKNLEREFVYIWAARAVKAGDSIMLDSALGIRAQVSAPEDGYELDCYDDAGRNKFLTKAEFEEKTAPAGKLDLPLPKEELSAEELAAMTPVKKGEKILINDFLPRMANAECDGFLIKTGEGDKNFFLNSHTLTSAFNGVTQKFGENKNDIVVSLKDEAPRRGMLLREDVTFAFKAGDYEAKAGSLLFINPDDEDGYTVTGRIEYPNAALRVISDYTQKAAKEVADKQNLVKRKVARIRI